MKFWQKDYKKPRSLTRHNSDARAVRAKKANKLVKAQELAHRSAMLRHAMERCQERCTDPWRLFRRKLIRRDYEYIQSATSTDFWAKFTQSDGSVVYALIFAPAHCFKTFYTEQMFESVLARISPSSGKSFTAKDDEENLIDGSGCK